MSDRYTGLIARLEKAQGRFKMTCVSAGEKHGEVSVREGYNDIADAINLLSTVDDITAERDALRSENARLREALEYMRPEVYNFACDMEKSLRQKDVVRGGNSWQVGLTEDEVYSYLSDRMETIASLICRANYLQNNHRDEIEVSEASYDVCQQSVHLANFAMMLADISCPQRYRQALKSGEAS